MQYSIILPQNVKIILSCLQKNGYEAYVVGGCVRDSLLKKTPTDWDITTSANPSQMMKVFQSFHIIPTGLKHGTITVRIKGESYEVTTYRIDGEYNDGRRPEQVLFTNNLQEDLKRRDFTVNAMAYNQNGLVDYFNGQQDLKDGIIRCVGLAEERFQEDYLRMLRAYRFAAVLNFSMEKSVHTAAVNNRHKINHISKERIRVEFDKLLLSDNFSMMKLFLDDFSLVLFPEIEKTKGVLQNNIYHCYPVYEHSLEVLKHTKKDISMRLSALLHDIGKPDCMTIDSAGIIHFYQHEKQSALLTLPLLKRMTYDNKTQQTVMNIVENHGHNFKPEPTAMKFLLRDFGIELCRKQLDFYEADIMGKSEEAKKVKLPLIKRCKVVLEEVIQSKEPFAIKDLEINGNDLMQSLKLLPSKNIGMVLNELLKLTIENPSLNKKETLLQYAKEIYG